MIEQEKHVCTRKHDYLQRPYGIHRDMGMGEGDKEGGRSCVSVTSVTSLSSSREPSGIARGDVRATVGPVSWRKTLKARLPATPLNGIRQTVSLGSLLRLAGAGNRCWADSMGSQSQSIS